MYFFLPRFAIKRFRAKHSLLYASKHIQYIYYIYIYISLFVVFRSLFRCFRFLFIYLFIYYFFFLFFSPRFLVFLSLQRWRERVPFRDILSWATERSKSDHFPPRFSLLRLPSGKKKKESSKGEQVFSESRLYHKVAASFTNGLRIATPLCPLFLLFFFPLLFVLFVFPLASFFVSFRLDFFFSFFFFFFQAWTTRLFAKYLRSPRSNLSFYLFLSLFLSLSRKRALSYALASWRPKKKKKKFWPRNDRHDHTLSTSPFSHIVSRTDRGGL